MQKFYNMQRKTIKKIVQTKMEEWLETITDEDLRKKVKDELLVSGGSIASLFLGEQVNDFDVYIKTPETAFALAMYYSKPYNGLDVLLGKDREKYLKEIGVVNEEDGGKWGERVFVENLHPEQVKIFTGLGSAGYKTDHKDEGLNKFVPLYFSPNAISLSDKVQIVLRFTGDNEAIHSTFDFIHATNYFTFEYGLVTNVEALESLLSKQLKYQGSKYPLTSIIRTKKFLKRHWNISAGEYLKIMFQISDLDLNNPNVLEEQLIGVDIAYFSMLVDILRGKRDKDPNFQLTSAYLNTLIDKIFNDTEETA